MAESHDGSETRGGEFARQAAMKPTTSFGEYVYLLKKTKKWWMAPILIIFALFGLLLILSSTPTAPFIYTLF